MTSTDSGLPANEWSGYFHRAKVLKEKLDAAQSKRSTSTIIGNWLSPLVGREVPIEVNKRCGVATLRLVEGRAKEKRYFFEVRWTDPPVQS